MEERRPGWYEVHGGPGTEAYWDGAGWTDFRTVVDPSGSISGQPEAAPAVDTQRDLQPGDNHNDRGASRLVESGNAGARATFEPNPIGLAVAGFGAVLAVVGVFLPQLESPGLFPNIRDNTLIASGEGWIVLGVALATVARAYAAYRNKSRNVAPLLLGLVLVGFAIYQGTGSRLDLDSTAPRSSVLHFKGTVRASPAVGLYMVGVGGAAVVVGGLMLAGMSEHAQAPSRGGAKTCPECAESVLVAARVCKHCGHRLV